VNLIAETELMIVNFTNFLVLSSFYCEMIRNWNYVNGA